MDNFTRRARASWQREFGSKAADAAVAVTTAPAWRRHHAFEPTFENMEQAGYRKNDVVSTCVDILMRNFKQPPLWSWEMGDDGKRQRQADTPLRELFSAPNSDMGEAELLATSMQFRAIGGGVCLWKMRDRAGRVIRLYPFHYGDMKPIPGRTTEEGLVAYFVLHIPGSNNPDVFGLESQRFDTWPGIAFPTSEIVHWKWAPDPRAAGMGLGPIGQIALQVGTDTEASTYTFNLLGNNATPPLIINLAEGEDWDQDALDRYGEMFQQKYSAARRGRPAFLPHGYTPTPLAFDMDKLAMSALRGVSEARICAKFGVPPEITGLPTGLNSSTYSNRQESRRMFLEDVMTSHWRDFASEVARSFENEPGWESVGEIAFDESEVTGLKDTEEARQQRLLDDYNASAITLAEYRRGRGWPAGPEHEVYKTTLTSVFVPALGLDAAAVAGEDEGGNKALKFSEEIRYSTARADSADIDRQRRAVGQLRALRERYEPEMIAALDAYSADLAERVVTRFTAAKSRKASGDELILPDDEERLGALLRRFRLAISNGTWDLLNVIVDQEAQWRENDPAIADVLADASERVKDITDYTRGALNDVLRYGADHGWSIDQFVEGQFLQPGISQVVEETYKNRSRAIARTELGTAQNKTTIGRYASVGAQGVIVFDNGFDNSHEICRALDGTVQTLQWAQANPLQHPNCVRAFGVWFGE